MNKEQTLAEYLATYICKIRGVGSISFAERFGNMTVGEIIKLNRERK